MSLVTSILIAFCFDYQLFLLSRFREAAQIRNQANSTQNISFENESISHPSVSECVIEMLESAGHNILVSGSTLLFAFGGLALVPQSTLRGLGVGR
jgi:uncharacterized membrane protein YdfJ with MMPL/SSD domain